MLFFLTLGFALSWRCIAAQNASTLVDLGYAKYQGAVNGSTGYE